MTIEDAVNEAKEHEKALTEGKLSSDEYVSILNKLAIQAETKRHVLLSELSKTKAKKKTTNTRKKKVKKSPEVLARILPEVNKKIKESDTLPFSIVETLPVNKDRSVDLPEFIKGGDTLLIVVVKGDVQTQIQPHAVLGKQRVRRVMSITETVSLSALADSGITDKKEAVNDIALVETKINDLK